jgi:hypothetical protein
MSIEDGSLSFRELSEIAHKAFLGYRDQNTGWGVPPLATFTVSVRDGLPESWLYLEWELSAAGFGKRPEMLAESGEVKMLGQDREVIEAQVEHLATALACNCLRSYILWCGRKVEVLT